MVLKIYGVQVSANVTPIMGLVAEAGIESEFVSTNLMTGEHKTPEYLKMNPMHTVPTIDDGGFTMWESKSILRYIANKHKLDSFYPADVQKRALCDLALDFFANSFYPIAGNKILYPAAGWGAPVPEAELKEIEKKFNDDVIPAFQHLLSRNGGALLGGAKPNLADLACVALLGSVFAKCPDSFVSKNAVVSSYFAAAKAALPKYGEWMGAAEGYYGAK